MSQIQRSNSMETLEQRKENIINELKKAEVSKIVLLGDAGMGKTWMARKIIDLEELWYETLWVYVTEKYDINLFYKDIARQLSLSSITEEWEHEEENSDKKNQNLKEMSPNSIAEENEHEGENSDKKNENFKKLSSSSIAGQELEHEKENSNQKNQNIKKMSERGYEKIIEWGYEAQEETTESLKKKIQEKMGEIIEVACSGESKYFLLVLDDGGNNLIKNELHEKLSNERISMLPSKFPNCLKIIITTRELGSNNVEQTSKVYEFKPSLPAECLTLLQSRVDKKVSDIQSFQQLGQAIAEKSEGIPAAIIVIAEALNYIARHDDSKLESAISKASRGINPLFYCAFDMITSSVTKNCFWHSMHLFRSYSGVHYNELITHWVMEGYFDPFDHIEEAYQKGHGVLMELIDRALLKIQENNIVEMERTALNKIESCLLGFSGTASVRLFSVFKDNKSLGRVTWMDGMIKTLCNPKNWEKNTTLLIDGSRLSREVHQRFFDSIKGLEVLAVFNGRCKSLASSLSKMEKLLVLVLRSCDLLDDITDHINKLKTLKVLEISGASSLKSMPDKLFDGMTNLQSLNLSGLQMETLPSFSKLSELLVLILRGCSRLEKLQSLQGLGKLQILDISGASSLKSMPNNLFDGMTNLQSLSLSGLQMETLPSFSKPSELLILRGCSRLEKLQSLQGLGKLQILDISGASSLKSMPNNLFDGMTNLQSLNLSGLQMETLPSFSKLSELLVLILRGCSRLEKLQSLQGLGKLQILDISGASSLKSMPNNLFDGMTNLQSLNLSGLQMETLPSFSKLSELLVLILRGCSHLEKLQSLQGLGKLQTLDISEATSFERFDDPTLSVLPKIQMINLCNTNIQLLPEFGELQDLTQIFLRGCRKLCILPTLQLLKSLQILDLSGAIIFKTFSDESIEHLEQLRILDLSKTSISKLPSVGCHTHVIQPNEELRSAPINSSAV